MLSVANSCHYNESSKNGKHCVHSNACPSGAAPTNPCPRQKLERKCPRVWGQIFGANPGGCAQGDGYGLIDTCIGAVGCDGWVGLGPPIIAKTWIQTKTCLIQYMILVLILSVTRLLYIYKT